MSSGYPRRWITTDCWSEEHGVQRAIDDVNPRGDIYHGSTPAVAAASSQEVWDELDERIKALEPLLGWSATDDLLSSVNALQMAVRTEAIDRMIASARSMVDFEIGIFVAPGPETEETG